MTTADDLLAAIDAADAPKCARLLTDLDEKARRALYSAVSRRAGEADAELRDFSKPSRKESFERHSVARLALLGVATLGEAQEVAPLDVSRGEETAVAILANRRPEWLPDWAEFEVERNFRNWSIVRALVRGGWIPKPATEFYILGMIAAHRWTSPRQFLAADSALMDDELWRLFEHAGSGELSLAAYDKYVPESNSWFHTFLSMAADGAIERGRVLAATVDALQRDFPPFRAGWFSRLHEALKPAGSERAALCERYLDLLNSRVPATVSFAMKALMECHKAGGLDAANALDRLAPAFEARDKGTVERALALAARIGRGSEDRVAALAARALGHESPEVQTAALELVGSDAALIAPYLAVLAPSVRARLGAAHPPVAASAAVETDSAVKPVASVHELVETFSTVLENQGPPVEIERAIDGVARLGIAAARQAGFERLTGGLAKRAEKLLARDGAVQPRAALAALALAWTRERRVRAPQAEANLADFLVWRLWCASEQAAQRIEHPLLSLPTSSDGRIEAAEFDARRGSQRSAAETDRESLFHLGFLLARLRARGVSSPISARLVWKKRSWEVEGRTYFHHQAALEIEGAPQPSRFDPAALSTASFHSTLEMKRWCVTVCPHWREGWFAAGCRELGSNLDWWEADWSTRAYLEPLLHPHTPIGAMGALLVALGLGAKEAGEAGLATDALIAATGGSRLDAEALGRALTEAAASGAIKFARWARQLHRAAQTGAVQAAAIFLAIEALFEAGQGVEGGDFGRLAPLEYELAHLTGLRLKKPGALGALAALTAGGKTGRAASGLLKLSE